MKLVIVESPGKVPKVRSFLGADYLVMASFGHVRDLPTTPGVIGIEPPDFKLQYVPTEKGQKQLAELSVAAQKAEVVYLATDPDREGEAIAWHLKDALGLIDPKRISYHEITEAAVTKAIAEPRAIDMNLVHAQEGRRGLDRLVGYMVSLPVSRFLIGKGGLSVGRVQTPALRLIVDRETAIRNFRQTTHFGVQFVFGFIANIDEGWKAQWDTENWLEPGADYCLDQGLAARVAEVREFTVVSYEESEVHQAPPAPFATATLQQAASNVLGLSSSETMALAQNLYQNGHITYMRTDNVNLSNEAITEIRSIASQNDWPVPPKPRVWKNEAGAQEAHEAIRPSHFDVAEAGDNDEERALYKLIRVRALASQLCSTDYAVSKATLEGELDDKKVLLKASGRRMTNPGWRVLLAGDQSEEDDDQPDTSNPLPKLQEGQTLTATSGTVVTKKTKPPTRYTEGTLVKELSRLEIGRPATYASIIELIKKRGYAVLEKKQTKSYFVPTEIGQKIVAATTSCFSFADFAFTKLMEKELDKIAAGETEYTPMMVAFYDKLQADLNRFEDAISPHCPDCGGRLIHYKREATEEKKAMNFWGCSNFQKGCRAKFEDDNGQPGARIVPTAIISEYKCGVCGRPLYHHVKPEKGQSWWGCSGFKEGACDAAYDDDNGKPGAKREKRSPGMATEFKCPKCDSVLYVREGISKKNNKPYKVFNCSNRECKASFWAKQDGTPDFAPKKTK